MPITSDTPTTLPSTPLNKWWLYSFTKSSGGPADPTRIATTLIKFGVDGQGVITTDPNSKVGIDIDAFNPTDTENAAVNAVLDQFAAIRAGSPNAFAAVVELVSQATGAIAKVRQAIS